MNEKPLRGKAYGSISHLPTSRMGPGDHHCHEGQSRIATERTRDKRDDVSVTVKLDGSCMSVARIDGQIAPLVRAGYLARTSKYEQHHLFADWVEQNKGRFLAGLRDGERFVGEWLAQAHGTRYALIGEPFIVFDVMSGIKRLPIMEATLKAETCGLEVPYRISTGPAFSLEAAITAIDTPRHGEIDEVEGAVWRVERDGEFDFICKWVRPSKQDGRYLPEVTGCGIVWNWRPGIGKDREVA